MKLQTKIKVEPSSYKLDYTSKISCFGSCFASHIGEKLNYFKFDNLLNPFGILFHPIAIETLIQRALKEHYYEPEDCFKERDLWHHYDLHSSLSHQDKDHFIARANQQLADTNTRLNEASHIFITLGTAWVYSHLKQHKIVANCHKVAQQNFSKTLLTVEQIYESLQRVQTLFRQYNPAAKLIFTLSPIRHVKDGLIENQRSKAHLLTAIHRIVEEHEESSYFPSYEIVLDELRDYRFYAPDMIHPSALAIDYVWDKFKTAWIAAGSYQLMDKIDQIQRGLNHKPFNKESKKYLDFKENLALDMRKVNQEFPSIKFDKFAD